MEVTRSNFQEVLEELDSVLEGATFLAIDTEFTGLNSGPDAKPFDTPAQYYSKLRSGSMDFLMVQFGLSVFTHNAASNKYTQRSYNFYVFPRPLNRSAPDCRFMCQASSIAFLADNGFDFNKLFNFGIPYLTTAEEERLTKKIEEKQRIRDEGPEFIPISDDDKPQIEEICTRIEEFLASEAAELSIDRCNAFIRRLIHQEAKLRWPNKVRLQAKNEGGMQFMMVYKMGTKEEEQQKEAERREKEIQEMKNAVGLTVLLRKIVDSGKTIVGHNMLLDLCHIIHQFFGPLPESYREFKSLVHGLFPRLLDTKVICKAPQLKDKIPSSVLATILETISKEPFSIPDIEPVEARSYSLDAKKSHEAGYDAYITGLCFIALSNYLGSLQQTNCSTVLCDSPLLNPFLNKLLIFRLKDVPHINLVGNDPVPSRDHIFHMTFPKEWRSNDISQLFTPFGGVFVSWLTDTTAYAVLNKRDQSSTIIKNLQKNKRMKCCKIQTYADHQNSNDETEIKVDRKRKSPLESVAPRKDSVKEEADSANGAADNRVDEVWETVSGNQVKIVSSKTVCHQCEPIHSENPCLSQTRPRFKCKNRGGQADWRQGETTQPTYSTPTCNSGQQRDGEPTDKNTTNASTEKKLQVGKYVSPPTELRNDRTWTAEPPSYRILRRDLEPVDLSDIAAPEKEEDDSENDEEVDERRITNSAKKTSSQTEISRLTEGFMTDSEKDVSSRSLTSGSSQISQIFLKTSETTPTASPKARRSPKRRKSGILASESTKNNLSPKSSRTSARDEQSVRKRLASVDDVDGGSEKVELKKPTLKLLKSTKRRSDSVFTPSLLVGFAQRAFVILIIFLILVMLTILRKNGFLAEVVEETW